MTGFLKRILDGIMGRLAHDTKSSSSQSADTDHSQSEMAPQSPSQSEPDTQECGPSKEEPVPLGNEEETSSPESVRPHHRKVIPKLPPKKSKESVYIGIDFGTTFTKVAYTFANDEKRMVEFAVEDALYDPTDQTSSCERIYFKPSILFYDKATDTLSYQFSSSARQIRYFKYRLLKQSPCGLAGRTNDEAMICCVYFMGCLLAEIKQWICKKANKEEEELDYHVNMGVPFDNFNEKDGRYRWYDEVLNVGYLLSTFHPGNMPISQIRQFIDAAENVRDPHFRTFPELYAEILYFQNDSRFSHGFYTVVDVGGGTLDIALFEKIKHLDHSLGCTCIAHKVLELGVDVLSRRIAIGNQYQVARAALLKGNLYNSDVIDQEKKRKAEESFYQGYGGVCVQKAFLLSKKAIKSQKQLRCFILGGGKHISWYRMLVKTLGKTMETAGVPPTEIATLERYMPPGFSDRLVIAEMLADNPDSIPPLDGYPWNYIVTENSQTHTNVEDKLRQIIASHYGV